jgi:hypothetical protein
MRKLTLIFTLLAATLVGVASAQNTSDRFFFAADFNKWALAGTNGTNVFTFNTSLQCITNPYSAQSYSFNTNAPVYINDTATPANSEVVTPSSLANSAGVCGFNASPSHTHYANGFFVQSGTAGLQEILNWLSKTSSTPSVVVVDASWYGAITSLGLTPATVIAAAQGGTGITLLDTTKVPFQTCGWTGTAYTCGAQQGPSGAGFTYFTTTELMTLATGAQTTDSTGFLLPANSIIDLVQGVVNTTITTACTGWELGDSVTAARFSSNDTTLTAGEAVPKASFAPAQLGTGVASATTGVYQAAAAHLRVTCAGGNPGAGKVRVVVYGRTFINPTS